FRDHLTLRKWLPNFAIQDQEAPALRAAADAATRSALPELRSRGASARRRHAAPTPTDPRLLNFR
ncbi:hypothetical protein, partial [Nocardia sp. NPDC003345]